MYLARSRHGTMIHRRDCVHVLKHSVRSRAMPWEWADDLTECVVAWAIVKFGYRTCQHCEPVSEEQLDGWRGIADRPAVVIHV